MDNVRSLFRDRSGIVWVGTENGIYKYDPHVVYLSTINLKIKPDKSFTNTQTVPLCILKDKSSSWWLGSYNGIFIFDTTTGHLKNYSEKFGIPKSTLVANIIQDSSGAIWLSAYNQLIRVTKNKQSNYESKIFKSANIQSNIYYLYLDNENRIWIGTHSEGVFRFDEASQKFISYPDRNLLISSNAGEIRSFYEISKDSVLVGGAFTGLLLLHVNENRFEKIHWKNGAFPTSDLSINSITENKKSIWIGTEYNGLLQSDKQFEKLNAYTFRNGLPSMNIYSIISGNRNKLWLLTAAGVVDFQPENNHITVYNQKDGVKNLSYLQCIAQDCNGTILFGDLGCVHILKSSQIISNNKPPNVFITGFKIFDKSYPINAAQTIHLNYNQNYFSFDFTALNYTQPELNKYAYKLEGLDKQWNDAGNRRYVSYVNLKEGTYVFKVKACNNEGVWNAVPATLTLIIQPPFWHEWWFYLLVCLLVISVAYFIYRIKINQLKIKQQLRNKIARDLHDDIGSTLSGINIFSKLALQKMYTEKNAAAEILQKISDRSERTMDALSDIVWSINTKNDDMQNVLAKMQEHLSETLEPQQIKYHFIVDENMQHIKPDMELRKELYLIFKEAICNASKYASCSFVNISLARKKDVCTLIIHDNGKGFDINKIVPGNGIHNMQHRAEKIKGSFIINSEINKGTFIQLQFHLT